MKKKVYLNLTALSLLLFFTTNIGCKTTKTVTNPDRYNYSDYIFLGQVVQSGRSNLSVIPDAGNTYIVRVDDIILASSGHESFKGDNITVVIDNEKLQSLKEKTGYIFYTKTWLFGNTLGVKLVNAEPETGNMNEIKEDLAKYQESVKNSKISERIKKAELVFVGDVIDIQDADLQSPVEISEHNPDWKVAIINVRKLLKGEWKEDQIKVFFSASDDVNWVNAPKLDKARSGIFLLTKTDEFMGIKNAYILISSDDLLPESELKNVKKLIK